MGLIANVLSFVRGNRGAKLSDVKVDKGGGDNVQAEHYLSLNDDSVPLPGDYVLLVDDSRTGGLVAAGYLDPKNQQKSNAGDKRIYARNASGDEVIELWLKNDGVGTLSNANGSITLQADGGIIHASPAATLTIAVSGAITGSNGSGSFALQAGGDFVVNGATIDTSGRFTDGDGLVFNTHQHAQGNDGNGDAEVDTNGPQNP